MDMANGRCPGCEVSAREAYDSTNCILSGMRVVPWVLSFAATAIHIDVGSDVVCST